MFKLLKCPYVFDNISLLIIFIIMRNKCIPVDARNGNSAFLELSY